MHGNRQIPQMMIKKQTRTHKPMSLIAYKLPPTPPPSPARIHIYLTSTALYKLRPADKKIDWMVNSTPVQRFYGHNNLASKRDVLCRNSKQINTGSVLLRFTKIPGVFQVFSRLILNFPGVKTIPILSIADRISYKYVCYLS